MVATAHGSDGDNILITGWKVPGLESTVSCGCDQRNTRFPCVVQDVVRCISEGQKNGHVDYGSFETSLGFLGIVLVDNLPHGVNETSRVCRALLIELNVTECSGSCHSAGIAPKRTRYLGAVVESVAPAFVRGVDFVDKAVLSIPFEFMDVIDTCVHDVHIHALASIVNLVCTERIECPAAIVLQFACYQTVNCSVPLTVLDIVVVVDIRPDGIVLDESNITVATDFSEQTIGKRSVIPVVEFSDVEGHTHSIEVLA